MLAVPVMCMCITARRQEESVRNRRALAGGNIDQIEHMYLVAQQHLAEKPKLHYSGNNTGNYYMGPIQLAELSSVWQLSFGEKQSYTGHRIECWSAARARQTQPKRRRSR